MSAGVKIGSPVVYAPRAFTLADDKIVGTSVASLYDIESRTWSDALAPDITELDRLPEIAWTTEIAGTVTRQAAEQTGLASGTPVIVGTIDAAA